VLEQLHLFLPFLLIEIDAQLQLGEYGLRLVRLASHGFVNTVVRPV
jgi:hypothetical protein